MSAAVCAGASMVVSVGGTPPPDGSGIATSFPSPAVIAAASIAIRARPEPVSVVAAVTDVGAGAVARLGGVPQLSPIATATSPHQPEERILRC